MNIPIIIDLCTMIPNIRYCNAKNKAHEMLRLPPQRTVVVHDGSFV